MVQRYLKLQLRAFNGELRRSRRQGALQQRDRDGAKDQPVVRGTEQARARRNTAPSHRYTWISRSANSVSRTSIRNSGRREKEEQRRIREQMREEERVRREIEKAKSDAEKEEQRYETALEKARQELQSAGDQKRDKLQSEIERLQSQLDAAHETKERALSRAQLTKSGHVYIVSNIGSFGENVYKIGLTRRLDPKTGSGSSAMRRYPSRSTSTRWFTQRTHQTSNRHCTVLSTTGGSTSSTCARSSSRYRCLRSNGPRKTTVP